MPAPDYDGPILVEPGFQHYAWGDREIMRIYGMAAADKPYAEAWFGAHPALPSQASIPGGGDRLTLDRLLDAGGGDAILGPEVRARFGGLPFLVKILAVARPLSIQVHPSRSQAVAGFAREQAAGMAPDDPARSYRDAGAKPELIVALTRFQALCGFRPASEIAAALEGAAEVSALLPPWQGTPASLRELLAAYFALPDDRLQPALGRWVDRLRAEIPTGATAAAPGTAAGWVIEADRLFSTAGRRDRGLLFVALLNLVTLDPGEALFLAAGVPHAYLRGAGVEVMASSDNVLRAGLTPKPVRTDQLLSIVLCDSNRPPTLRPVPAGAAAPGTPGAMVYPTPAEEFAVHRLDITATAAGDTTLLDRSADGPELLLFIGDRPQAALRVETPGRPAVDLGSGQSCLIPDRVRYRVSAATAGAAGQLFRVAVPRVPATSRFRGGRAPELAFGTSGLRGLVDDITDFEAYVNTHGFLDHLIESGAARAGTPVAIAGDLRPSTDSPDRSIMRAVARAIADAGFDAVNCGHIPTPALAHYAFTRGWPSVMITGSHIPFDRNGIKFYLARREVLKADEAPILAAVDRCRRAERARAADWSLFDDGGMFRPGARPPLPPALPDARALYIRRYLDFFPPGALGGMRIVVYQHTAVGRDIVTEVLRGLGAEVHPQGRATAFVAIDTEAIAQARLDEMQALADRAAAQFGPLDALVSTDGDSDRPLVLGIDAAGRARFLGGDLLGILVADYLGADAIAVPVTATDAIDIHFADRGVRRVRTRVGSPYVIAAMAALTGGARRVGWEANGGFMTFSEIARGGRTLAPLPTRDALLPITAVLHAARERNVPVADLLDGLPRRFTQAGLLDGVDPAASRALVAAHAVGHPGVAAAVFAPRGDVRCWIDDTEGNEHQPPAALRARLESMRADVARHFGADRGFGPVTRFDLQDGLRITFDGGDVAHVRPSGNAPQLRIYALSGSEARAQEIVALSLDGEAAILPAMLAEALARATAHATKTDAAG